MLVLTISVGHVVLKLSSVDIALGMPELTLTLSLVIAPVPLIMSAIDPVLNSISVSELLHVLVSLAPLAWPAIRHPLPHVGGRLAELTSARLVLLLHLSSVTAIVGIDIHIPIHETGLVTEVGHELLLGLHLGLELPHGVPELLLPVEVVGPVLI